MQYTLLQPMPRLLISVLCIMHTVCCLFVVGLCCVFVFICALLCIMYTICNEQRGGGVVLCAMYEGRGRGGIEVAVRRRYPTSTLSSIFNSPGPSTLLTTTPQCGIIQLHQSPPFGLVYRAISQQGPALLLRGLILCPQNTIFFILS